MANPHPSEALYGDGKFREFDPLGNHRVITASGTQNQHPSVKEKRDPSLTAGMGAKGMKYQQVKRQPRKGRNHQYDLAPDYNEGEEPAESE